MALPRQNTITMQTIASSRSNALGSLCIACSSPATVCENTQVCDRFLYSSESIVGEECQEDDTGSDLRRAILDGGEDPGVVKNVVDGGREGGGPTVAGLEAIDRAGQIALRTRRIKCGAA